jgi:hypothetical protein
MSRLCDHGDVKCYLCVFGFLICEPGLRPQPGTQKMFSYGGPL